MLALHTMRFDDELVDGDELDFEAPRRGAGEREVRWPASSSSRCTSEFRPERYEDEYREAVLELIERKAAGEEIEPRPRRPTTTRRT